MPLVNPYNSQEALMYSNYSVLTKNSSRTTTESPSKSGQLVERVENELRAFIKDKKHPCIIARSTIRSNSCRFGVYPSLGSKKATAGLSHDLIQFLNERPQIQHPYASYMAVFEQPLSLDEESFEELLWQQLHHLNKASAPYYAWDNSTSSDPMNEKFGFSFGGKAFYVVGMHPNSSRKARQFAYPMLVFNLHEQFEAMRTKGNYEKVKSVIRKNDVRLQGDVNPMLDDFGKSSEARQYSGRAVPDGWTCPYLFQQASIKHEKSEKCQNSTPERYSV